MVEFTVRSKPEPERTPEPEPLSRIEPRHPLEPERRELALQARERRERDRLEEREPVRALSPEPRAESPASSPARIDLNLRALPLGEPGGLVVGPSGTGTASSGSAATGTWHSRVDAGDPITGRIREAPAERFPLKAAGGGHFVYSGQGFSAHIQPDGEVSFDDKYLSAFKGTSGSFDVTDMVMRGKGQDPYRHEKQRFLEATAELRAKMAARLQAERLRASVAGLGSTLSSIWSSPRPAAERRRQLLALWDEIDDGGETALERAGQEARATILGWVRARIPRDSTDAFTEEELRRHNQPGRRPFLPY